MKILYIYKISNPLPRSCPPIFLPKMLESSYENEPDNAALYVFVSLQISEHRNFDIFNLHDAHPEYIGLIMLQINFPNVH